MDDLLARVWEDLLGRVSGPMKFRILIQPCVALFLGIRDGLTDFRLGRPAYFWSIFTDAGQRRFLLREGWSAVAKVFIIAAVVDTVYQILVLRFVFPGEVLIVAFLLAILPYLLIRGPVNRIATAFQKRRG
jgi:hypothetical protein